MGFPETLHLSKDLWSKVVYCEDFLLYMMNSDNVLTSEILISRCDSEDFSYYREETFNTFPTKLNPRTVVHNW